MCSERSNVLTHFSVCVLLTFPLAMQTATTSELPTRQKEGEGWGRRRRSESESEGDNDRATVERGRKREGFGEVGGEKEGRGACEAVSQHISNERRDVMCWRRRGALNNGGCIKYRLLVFLLQSISLPLYFTFRIRTKDGTRGLLKHNCISTCQGA